MLNLTQKHSIILTPTSPFNFDATLHKPSHFPSSDCCWAKGKYWITMLWPAYAKASAGKQGKYLGLKFEDKGTTFKPKIKLNIYSHKVLDKKFIKNLIPEIEWRFNLKNNICEFCKKFKDADKRWGQWKNLALHYIWEDIFWQRKYKKIAWLEKEIRL